MSDVFSVFISDARVGGANKNLIHISKYFANNGYDVDYILSKSEGEFYDDIPSEVNIVDLGSSRQLYSIHKLANYLQRRDPSVLLSTTHSSIVIMQLANLISFSNVKTVARQGTSFSEEVDHSPTIKHRLVGYLYRLLLPRSDKVIAISRGVKQDLVESTRLLQEDIDVIYNPAILSVEDVEAQSKELPNHPWFSNTEESIILGAGRLTEQKDFPTLIKAFKMVRKKTDCKLVIIGEGSDRKKIQKLAADLGVKEHISLPGYTDNPYRYMAHSDVFVLSSQWEGFGVVLVEAMACGTPIVSTDCKSGPAEILKDGEFGYLSPVSDYSDIAQGIRHMIESPTDPAKLKDRASDFTIDNVQEYERIIFD